MQEKLEHGDTIDKVFDTTGAAGHLGVSGKCLAQWRWRGGGPVFRKLGSRVVYLRQDLDLFLDKCARRSTSDAGKGAQE